MFVVFTNSQPLNSMTIHAILHPLEIKENPYRTNPTYTYACMQQSKRNHDNTLKKYHIKGSRLELSRFKFMYTSVPCPSTLSNLRSPPKYRAYNLDNGSP